MLLGVAGLAARTTDDNPEVQSLAVVNHHCLQSVIDTLNCLRITSVSQM